MAIDNFKMGFESQRTHKVPTRNRPDKYAQSPLAKRARFEVSEGQRPAEYFAPYKYLPAMEKDITTEDFVVIPKGRILSSISVYDVDPAGGIKTVPESGMLYGFDNQITGSIDGYSQDGSYFGYDEYITNLVVPCNGGEDTTVFYTSVDEQANTMKSDATRAAAGDSYGLSGNIPIGVAFHDWYQDIRGEYLNYRMWPDGGHVLTDWYVEVPYVVQQSGDALLSVEADYDYNADADNKFDVFSQFAYLTIASGDVFQPGIFVKADTVGNYIPQYDAANALTGGKTVQTVGKLIGIDTRFPKSGLEDVQTYPGSRMPGTQTAGLPSFLFEFVNTAETALGRTPTIESILNAVQTGKYGVARIQILVS